MIKDKNINEKGLFWEIKTKDDLCGALCEFLAKLFNFKTIGLGDVIYYI